jgi:hypothetical protein
MVKISPKGVDQPMSQPQQLVSSEPDPEPSGRREGSSSLAGRGAEGSLKDLLSLVRDADSTSIHLLCIRPPGDFARFDSRLAILAARYADVRITYVPLEQAEKAVLPSVVLVRGGEIVGEAIGDLPLRELDEVVRCAATWPCATATAA